MSINGAQVMGGGERGDVFPIACTRRPVQKRLILALQLVIEHDTDDASAFPFDACGFGLKEPKQLCVVRELARFHEACVEDLQRLSGGSVLVRLEKRFTL